MIFLCKLFSVAPEYAIFLNIDYLFCYQGNLEQLQEAVVNATGEAKRTLKREKDDLVNHGRRARFVDFKLLPPHKDKNDVLSIIQDARRLKEEKDFAEPKKKATGSIFAGTVPMDDKSHYTKQEVGDEGPKMNAAESRAYHKKLRGKQVFYGKGRLRSSHMLKGGIEYPMNYVRGDYVPTYLGGAAGIKRAIERNTPG